MGDAGTSHAAFGPFAALAAMGVGVMVVSILVGLAIAVAICWFLMICFQRIPAEHRKQKPEMVWLLLIPCFGVVWNFFVLPKLSESFKSYFDSVGQQDVGDCGRKLAMWCCILGAAQLAGVIPLLGAVIAPLAGIAGLVLWIMFMIKANDLKNRIPQAAVGA